MIQVGYCTNVHAGADLDAMRANLARHALAVKRAVCPSEPLGVGLWLSASAAAQLRASGGVAEFAAWLAEAGLVPFTFNGFPYGDFHRDVVKYDVYRPTWCEASRVDYTLALIEILDALLPKGIEGSISTVPLQWSAPAPSADELAGAAANLRRVAERLERLEMERGRLIYLCIEPEPGCVLERSSDLVDFFGRFLLGRRDDARVRRYLRVCHDVCHAAVMFEDQAEALGRYRAAGIGVGKVQVSSALALRLERLEPSGRAAALEELRAFAEGRYLHQTVVRRPPGESGSFTRFDDLPTALASTTRPSIPASDWRIHFHVPIHLERIGRLETTQPEIARCLEAARHAPGLQHFEVETYAWQVLPLALRPASLSDGIACELAWFRDRFPDFWRRV